jgi:hypothetical protein
VLAKKPANNVTKDLNAACLFRRHITTAARVFAYASSEKETIGKMMIFAPEFRVSELPSFSGQKRPKQRSAAPSRNFGRLILGFLSQSFFTLY